MKKVPAAPDTQETPQAQGVELANATSRVLLSKVVFAVLLGAGELTTRTLVGGGLIVLAALLAAGSSQEA